MLKSNIGASSKMIVVGVVCSVSLSMAATDVYSVKPTSVDSSGNGNNIKQYFVATCDSIDSISFFVGSEQKSKMYTASIFDSITTSQIWSSTKSSDGWKYQDMGFSVHNKVTRGRKYYLQLSISDGNWNYFYQGGNPYPWGKSSIGNSRDIVARIIGTNYIDNEFWGTNAALWCDYGKDTVMSLARNMGIHINREQIPWFIIQPDTESWQSFHWDRLDSAVLSAKMKGIKTLINFYGVPSWASSKDPNGGDSDAIHNYPPINMDKAYDDTINPNYLYRFIHKLVERYSDDSFNVNDYEIYNEPGSYSGWHWGWGEDTFYYGRNYTHDASGRVHLYVTACNVAYNAIKEVDSDAQIYAPAITNINTLYNGMDLGGNIFLGYFYYWNGDSFTDIITYHWYPSLDHIYYPPIITDKFVPAAFDSDYNSIRDTMIAYGDRFKPVWADEGGFSSMSSTDPWCTSPTKQADIVLQVYLTGLRQKENGKGSNLNQINWLSLSDWNNPNPPEWWMFLGLTTSSYQVSTLHLKESGSAYKQMTTKLNSLFYNTVIPFLPKNPNRWDTIRCYEFQTVDTGRAIRKTWVVWRDTSGGMTSQMPPDTIFFSVRTDTIYKQSIQYTSKPDSTMLYPGINGKVMVLVDSYPVYYFEKKSAPLHRSDIIVDSFYISPANPTAGQWVKFTARIKNIGNDSLKASIADTVTFQVDAVTKKKYKASRGLGLPGSGKDTLTIAGSTNDWQATAGNHLLRAWIDMNDIYAELKEDNNVKYLWKNISNPFKNSIEEGNSLIPLYYFIDQSQPNPTSGKTVVVKYGLPKASSVNIVVYNVAGQAIWEYNQTSQKPGYYSLRWNLRDRFENPVASGIYFYRLRAENWIQTRKMIVIK